MKFRSAIVFILILCTYLWFLTDSPLRSLWPTLLALATVLLIHRAFTGLMTGAFAGLLLLSDGNPFTAFVSGIRDHLIPSLQSSWNISVIIFTLVLGGFVALIEAGGGVQTIASKFLSSVGSARKKIQWTTYGLGLICFFDGLANSLLVGKSLTPVAKKVGVSKEKMAYIVDSTSAAVACVAIISTWIAYQLSMIREGFAQVGIAGDAVNPFSVFLTSIPYNFYCWFTLILLAVVIWRNWNLGPMKKAEAIEGESIEASNEKNSRGGILGVTIPLVFLIFGLLIGLYGSGNGGQWFPLTLESLANAYGKADAALVMVCVSILASVVAFIFNFRNIQSNSGSPNQAFQSGVIKMLSPILILMSAWLLSSTLKELGTVVLLSKLLDGVLPPSLYPMAVFVVGTIVSFSTGTSWGTMGVLMPLALPVALNLSMTPEDVTVYATVAAVFSGAVFGDHCSPFSDTTIVSSVACDLEPIDHVKTQIPYAVLVAIVALILGFFPVGMGYSPFICLIAGSVLLIFAPSIYRSQ